MKIKKVMILICFLIILSGIGIVSAETLMGTLGGTGIYNTSIGSYTSGGGGGTDYTNASYMILYNTEYLSGTVSYIRWDLSTGANDKVVFKIANSEPGEAANFIGYIGSDQVCTGTIGYQRYWNGTGVEQIGYQYVVFNSWTLGTKNGTQYLNLSYDHAALHYMYYDGYGAWQNPSPPTGYMQFRLGMTLPNGNNDVRGNHQILKQDSFTNTYSVTRPAGIGTSGSITKGGYSSKIYIINATSNIPVASESTVTPTNYNFTTTANPIYIAAYSSLGNWYNSSTLFSVDAGAPTPTPTPTPTVTLLPGQFWTTFAAQDATTGGLIPGAEIDIYSRFSGTWNNATSTSGERTIASSSDNYYDVYGSASGYTNGTLTNVMAYNNAYYLVNLFPTTGLPSVPGEVNLFVSVTERETGQPIPGASVSVATPGSWTVQGETDDKGIESFSTSNSSVKYITVSKTGYKAETRMITTPASGNYNAVLQMSRIVVTTVPTGYIPPGGVTPVTTMDPRSTTEKDEDMMNMIRDSGPTLIQLAIAVTMISLLGLMTKGFGK